MLKALNELQKMGVTVVIAGVNVDNMPSLLFFNRMGFVFDRSEGKRVWLKRRL
jgi:L-amino acid N-acyltransferase YncA